MACTLVWFRRDLRLEDNPALIAAARAGTVVPVFIWSPEEEGQFQPGRVSRWWLKQSLIHLDQSLRSLGAPLILRRSKDSLSALLDIARDTAATQIFFNHLYDPVSLVRDHRIKQGLYQAGLVVSTFNADLLYEPWEVNDDEGRPFTTFAAFWHKCLNVPTDPEPPLLPPKKINFFQGRLFGPSIEVLGLEDDSEKGSNALLARAWSPGWSNADRALEAFINGPLLEYNSNRQKIDSVNTSLLSPHLHFGELSVRKVFHQARTKQVLWAKEGKRNGGQSVELFLRAIGFREYSRYLCFNFPFTHEKTVLSNLESFPWRVDEGYFKAWRQGRTGYPLVDAGMRELWATGWLHNRIRVIVSSFCVKFLQLPWRWGMKYFWDTLLDADLECDVLGWQYISGSLPDGHDLDRMDNPQIEGYTFDPNGEYVRRWLPELSRLPTEWIHHPWNAPPSVLRAAGIELGSNYPRPIVEIAAARARLEQSLALMWEKDSVSNGVEEGLGDTIEVHGATTDSTPMEDIEVGGFHSNRCDQIVPTIRAAQFIPEALARCDQSTMGRASQTPLPNLATRESHQEENSESDSTAESSAVHRGYYNNTNHRPILPPHAIGHSSRLLQEEAAHVPVVSHGSFHRRHINNNPLPMVNLEGISSKTSSLSV